MNLMTKMIRFLVRLFRPIVYLPILIVLMYESLKLEIKWRKKMKKINKMKEEGHVFK